MSDESEWIVFAHEDLHAAQVLAEAQIWNQVCFHAQQSVEKLLKATLIRYNRAVPRTHVIADLWNLTDPTIQRLLAAYLDDLLDLDRYYIPTRYPDALPGSLPHGLPGRFEAKAALDVATVAMTHLEHLSIDDGPKNATSTI